MTSGLALDVRLAARALRAVPLVAASIVATLALAIGANTAIFSLVNSLLVRQLPVQRPEQLAVVSSDFAIDHGYTAGAGWSEEMWERFRDRSSGVAGAFAWHTSPVTIAHDGASQAAEASFVSGSFFDTLGASAREGRVLSAIDEKPDSDGQINAVLGDRGWRRLLAAKPDAVGSLIDVNGVPVRIVGIASSSFNGLEVGRSFDLALTLGAEQAIRAKDSSLGPNTFFLLVMVRLKDGQPIEGATRLLRQRQPEIVPPRAPTFASAPFTLVPAAGGAANPGAAQRVYRQPLLMTLGGVALVLLLACANVTNLLLARGAARRRDSSIAAALGASRWRLARVSLIETMGLAVCGALAGSLLALWAARAIVALTPVALDVSFDWHVGVFTAVVTTLTALIAGAVPAWRAMRVDPAEALKAAGRGVVGAFTRVQPSLAAVQLALAVVLLIGAGLLVRSFSHLSARPLGFNPNGLLVVSVDSAHMEHDETERLSLDERLVSAVKSLPGVKSAAGSLWTPLTGDGLVRTIEIRQSEPATKADVLVNFVTPGWFAAYEMPIKTGRDFGSQDAATSEKVVVVNEAFVRRLLPGQNPIGFAIGDQTIVGVAGDAVSRSAQRIPGVASLAVREPVPPTMYVPMSQAAHVERPPTTTARISVRASDAHAASLSVPIRATLMAIAPDLNVTFHEVTEDVRASLGQERMLAALSASFGSIALALAALGLYALMSYGVAQRTSAIGVRIALGATRPAIVALECRRAAGLVIAGVGIGLVIAAFVTRPLRAVLFEVSTVDAVTYATVAIVLGVMAVAAALLPAVRASRVNPVDALKA